MKHAIHCEMEEEAKNVLQIAHDAGLKWVSGGSLSDYTEWNGVDQCYNFSHPAYPGCAFQDPIANYKAKGYTIVKAQDFIEADRKQKEENETN